jgi:hypothetical protein
MKCVRSATICRSARRQLWLWGDRLLDGKLTGLGEWEASRN